ncbi:GIY-YIG nuclease family protein [Paenibacillus sp.]|uniref:GIY-YIG nuclease family protein n=1 Tax=Paenibacillus sp. TaxID=58172 RepID=UPI002D5162AA|nr:GIY-YIG nuclease family protein [Paenibacillus sp.]HZG87640.1 GIY-YIG nuclease family protein [Paenibacillus sp.]
MDKARKKELANEYVLARRPAGVYRMVHVESGKSYVGSTPDLPAMENRLPFELNLGTSTKKALLADWRKYGADAFRFEVLETFKPPEDGSYNLVKELERMEAAWLERLQPYEDKGYNRRARDE